MLTAWLLADLHKLLSFKNPNIAASRDNNKNDNYHNYNKIIQQIERENMNLRVSQGQIKHFLYKIFLCYFFGS